MSSRQSTLLGVALQLVLALGPSASAAAGDAGGILVLDAERTRGIATVVVARAEAGLGVPGIGRVLDPSSFVQAVRARETARTASGLALRESARTQALARGAQNASSRELEAAELASARASADLADAELRVTVTCGAAIGARSDLAALVSRITRGEAALARIDLAPGEVLGGTPATLSVSAPAFPGAALRGALLGPAPAADPALQGRSYLVLLDSTAAPIGAALSAELAGAGALRRGVALPASAIVWDGGHPVVFRALSEGRFERRDVTLAGPIGDGLLATEGVEPGDAVVSTGAQQLLSAQVLGSQQHD